MRERRLSLLAVTVLLAIFASACSLFGGGGDGTPVFETRDASSVKPPADIDPERNGLPGVILVTNSPSFQRVANSAEGKGAVVVFVLPGGPADKSGTRLAAGDLITAVDGQEVTNHEHATALLRQKPGQKVAVDVIRNDGTERAVDIELEDTRASNAAQFLSTYINNNPSEPLLRFVRASLGNVARDTRLGDLKRALGVDPDFVDAVVLQANLQWDARGSVTDPEFESRAGTAIGGWDQALRRDPENVTARGVYALAVSSLGNGAKARDQATEALEVDPTYPRALYALAVAQLRLGRPEAAADPASRAIALNPFDLNYYRTLAQAFAGLDRTDDCIATIEATRAFLEANRLSVEEQFADIC